MVIYSQSYREEEGLPEQRKRTLSYHRAEYLCEHPKTINLGLCIKQATGKLRTIAERSIQRPGGYMMRLAHYKLDEVASGCFLHLTFETPGEHASIVPHISDDTNELRVATLPPPNYAEFMDGDAFLYVNSNDAFLCATAITIGTVRHFLHAFFDKAAIRHDAGQFEFMNAMDTQLFALIQKKGIKEIEIKASMSEASAHYHLRKNHAAGVTGNVSRYFRSIVGSEPPASDDSLRVAVTVNLDKRHKKGVLLGHKKLEEIAGNIIQNRQENDEYTIILESGEKIRPRELVLRSRAEINSVGKSVVRDAAWAALFSYYEELFQSGRLDQ